MKKEDLLISPKWKEIQGYENLYLISIDGEIWSLCSNKIIKTYISKFGYERVVLTHNKKQKNFLVHRLVALAFIPNLNNYPAINHKDENKTNNNVKNLEWCTSKYNCNYGTRIKRISEKLKQSHKGKHFSRDTEFKKGYNAKMVRELTTNTVYSSMQEASTHTGVPAGNICMCCKGKLKQTRGLKWEYC